MCAFKMGFVAVVALLACINGMRVRKHASMLEGFEGLAGDPPMPILLNDFNPIGEGTIPGAHRLMILVFGDGTGISGSDLRDILISRRFPASYNFEGRHHGQVAMPERQRRNWVSNEEMHAETPHPGRNGFVEATMENVNFIICPFLSTMVNEGAIPLKQEYGRQELQDATEIAGLDPETGVLHIDGNFLNDPDGKQDIWNMEGFTNEHVTSTGIHDCVTQFRFCNHLEAPHAICQTETERSCRHPNRLKFEQFLEAVDSDADNFVTISELDHAAEVAEQVYGMPVFPVHEE